MPRTSETPEQRQARTAKARETLASRFSSPEERSAHYRRVAAARWHPTQSGAENVRSEPPDRHAG